MDYKCFSLDVEFKKHEKSESDLMGKELIVMWLFSSGILKAQNSVFNSINIKI